MDFIKTIIKIVGGSRRTFTIDSDVKIFIKRVERNEAHRNI
jgi:hypothetical protein